MNTSLRLNGSIDDHGKLSKLYFHVHIILSVWHYVTSIILIAMYITYCIMDHFIGGSRLEQNIKIFPRNIPSSSALGKTLWSARLFKVIIPFQGWTGGPYRWSVHDALIDRIDFFLSRISSKHARLNTRYDFSLPLMILDAKLWSC